MPIRWTKNWAGVDDGTILKGVDLKNFQQDMSGVLTKDDVGDNMDIVTHDNEVLIYDGDVLYL